ncbi:radial spoke head 10 homolog B isoform X2 [Spea bombifrons]|uniref:radial spoke head 10 homolog B isoform X2 n=1 Tax=Spea bombifrons TaxID=233779 RepID=UPI002349FEE3|nr:radial spoke head 10 homolog B isoform X2 [Spea bombifrons]
MGRPKKKESKKADKLTPESPEDADSKISSVSGTPTEDLSYPSLKSVAPEEPAKQEDSLASLPASEIYEEEPVLAQLLVEKYEGDMVHGVYEGYGAAHFKDGNTYRGTFSEGFMHGKGTYTWADGLIYEGEFHMNFPMGRGVYVWPDGSRYEGEVYKAIRHGAGIFISSNQQVSYAGQWCKGVRHGKGTIYYNSERTSWYEGDWINGNKDGWGVQRFKSGNIYEGHWKNNEFHGEGRMRWLISHEEYTGQWVHGIQNGQGTHTWFLKRVPGSQYSLRNEYTGNFVNGKRHGHGQFYYANGAMYDGEWSDNKKHGMGKFTFKNGKIYIGEFVEDHIAEYPNFKYDRVNTPDLSGIRTQSPAGSEKLNTSRVNSGIPSLSGSYMELDISSLLDTFPEDRQMEELKQVEFAVLRSITELRKIYGFYSSLGNKNAVDNALLMTKLQFWRFLKDCRFHHYNLTLSEMDRLLSGNAERLEVHSPHAALLLRTFLTNIVYLAYHICHEESPEKNISLVDCFCKIIKENVLPHAKNVQGFLFSEPQKTAHAMLYIDRCWEIYQSYCQPNTSAPYEPTMKMRHFVWLMSDLKITNNALTVTKMVDILAHDDPSVRNSNEINLELELTFLEFFEALLGCASVYVTDDLLELNKEEESPQNEYIARVTEQQPENLQQIKPACTPEVLSHENGLQLTERSRTPSTLAYSTENLEPENRSDKWFPQLNIFFMKIFFPAYEYAQQLKEEVPKVRERKAELLQIQKAEEEEEARLKAIKEAEEAKRIEEAELEKAAAVMEAAHTAKDAAEEDKNGQLPVTPKEEPPTPQSGSTKHASGTGKKKKK